MYKKLWNNAKKFPIFFLSLRVEKVFSWRREYFLIAMIKFSHREENIILHALMAVAARKNRLVGKGFLKIGKICAKCAHLVQKNTAQI